MQDELEEQQEENEEKAARERNARYLKEKCPTCAEKRDWFKKISQTEQICQLPITGNLEI
jgi:transposase